MPKNNKKKYQLTAQSDPSFNRMFDYLDYWMMISIVKFCTHEKRLLLACLNTRWKTVVDHPLLWENILDISNSINFTSALNPNVFRLKTRMIVDKKIDVVLRGVQRSRFEFVRTQDFGDVRRSIILKKNGRQVYVEIMKNIVKMAKHVQIDRKREKLHKKQRIQSIQVEEFLEIAPRIFILWGIIVLLPILITMVIQLDGIHLDKLAWFISLSIIISIPYIFCWMATCYNGKIIKFQLWVQNMKILYLLTMVNTPLWFLIMLLIIRVNNIITCSYLLIILPVFPTIMLSCIPALGLAGRPKNCKTIGLPCVGLLPAFIFTMTIALKLDGFIVGSWINIFMPLYVYLTCFCCLGTFLGCFWMEDEGFQCPPCLIGLMITLLVNCISAQLLFLPLKLDDLLDVPWVIIFLPMWIFYGAIFSMSFGTICSRMYNGQWPDFAL